MKWGCFFLLNESLQESLVSIPSQSVSLNVVACVFLKGMWHNYENRLSELVCDSLACHVKGSKWIWSPCCHTPFLLSVLSLIIMINALVNQRDYGL